MSNIPKSDTPGIYTQQQDSVNLHCKINASETSDKFHLSSNYSLLSTFEIFLSLLKTLSSGTILGLSQNCQFTAIFKLQQASAHINVSHG